jgi:hypothetical protein
MAIPNSNRIAWQYECNDGELYRKGAKKFITDQLIDLAPIVGGEAADSFLKAFPINFRPRRAYCVNNANGHTRYVVCYTEDALLWTTPGTTISLVDGADVADFTADGRVEERGPKATREQA